MDTGRLALILALLLSIPSSLCVHLDSDGGYHILVAVAEAEEVYNRKEAMQFINLVKKMLDDFGIALWTATNAEFTIKSAQILVPATWGEGLGLGVEATVANYADADMQISQFIEQPFTENYYPCERPGLRINLPTWFLDPDLAVAEFGSQSKALLNLWLRYRFGVWEEHGYPGHPTMPYFYKSHEDPGLWRLTSCNGSQLLGQLGPVQPNVSAICDLRGTHPLEDSCRFHPSSVDNHVATSIMNFQWISSIDALCDSDTHDPRAPNRQNLYCGHRSVWEVIRSSADFKGLKRSSEGRHSGEMPTIQYKVVIPNPRPLLYILLDLSDPDIDWNHTIYNPWVAELENFVETLPSDVFVKLAVYPNMLDSSTNLEVKLDWTKLDQAKRGVIIKELKFISGSQQIKFFDFRLPLVEVLSEMKRRSGSPALVLILRTEMIYMGQFIDNLDAAGPYEEDLALELGQHSISLYSVEVNVKSDPQSVSNMSLEYLTTKSGGMYAELTTPKVDAMHSVLMGILDRLSFGAVAPDNGRVYQLIYKEVLSNVTQKSVLIPQPPAYGTIHAHVTVVGARLDDIVLQVANGDSKSNLANFTSRKEWFPWMSADHRAIPWTYSATADTKELQGAGSAPLWELHMSVREGLGWMKGMVTVYSVAMATHNQPTLTAEISTSSDGDNKFGCVTRLVNEEPLAIYAKLASSVARGSAPVPIFLSNSSYSISAHLVHLQKGTCITTGLRDDGVGADLLAGDGVYSGYIYPHLEHLWRLHVNVYDITSQSSVEQSHLLHPVGRIHTVGQDKMEVAVKGATLDTPNAAVFEAPNLIRVTAPCVLKRFISRVVDTEVAALDEGESLKVSFTAPVVTSSEEDSDLDEEGGISGYFVVMAYLAEQVELLINDLTDEAVQVQGFLLPTTRTGARVEHVLVKRGNAKAYAMVVIEAGQLPTKSTLSNVILIKEWEPAWEPQAEVGCLIGCVLLIEIGGGLVILVLMATLFLLWRKNRRQATKLRMLSTAEVKEFLHGQKERPPSSGTNDALDYSDRIQALPYDRKYEIPSNKLHIDRTELLGSGTFGNVYKGYVVGHGAAGIAGKVLAVAVKTMKPDMDKSYFKVLLAEVKLMTHIGGPHPNIIRLVGACTKNIRKCQVFLATEFCSNGNLSLYLLKLETGQVTTWRLIKWAREIANGLEWLGGKKIVHGDLAARNILLDEELVAKVSDFGLSKQLRQYAKYEDKGEEQEEEAGGGLLPWKWVAPEVLSFGKFSSYSDVWSYGITLWEIFSLGQVPYPGLQWSPQFLNKLEHEGLRLSRPNWATDAVHGAMASCWAWQPKERPGFSELKGVFDQMMVEMAAGGDGDGGYLDLQVAAESFNLQENIKN